jgi:oxalate---CoA ligase
MLDPIEGALDLATTLDPLTFRGGDGVALIDAGDHRRISYDDLADAVDGLARQLIGIGIQPGATVAYSMSNGSDTLMVFLAIASARAVAAPLNAKYGAHEFRAYLDDLKPAVLLVRDTGPRNVVDAADELGIPRRLLRGGSSQPPVIDGAPPSADRAPAEPDDVALVLHTSGTTSKPKCVPIRHRNLAASARSVAGTYGLGPGDVSHCVMPLFHVHGLVASTLAALHGGGAVVVPPAFSAGAFWADGERHGATWFSAVPTIHHILTSRAESDLPSHGLRFARSCSAPLPPTLMEEFEGRFGIPLVEAYGMTEATHQMTSNSLPPQPRKAGSVGLPAGAQVRVVDDDWSPVPAGQAGEVTVSGPGVVDGYRDAPEATAASFRDGWFRTGDVGVLSADGSLRLDGRLKELINRGGEKISPYEVEAVLLRHPSVVEAVAFPLPDPKYGEVVAAVVVGADPDPHALTNHCAELLADFKVPSRIVVASEIPKGHTGKTQRLSIAKQLGA